MFRFLMILLATIVIGSTAYAAQIEPATLSYQGLLTDSYGTPLAGQKTIVVSLYSVATDGTAFWTDTYTVTPKNGQISIVLGRDGNALPVGSFTGTTYVGIKVGADAEMVPRQKVASVAYALKAAAASSVTQAAYATLATMGIAPVGSIIAYGGTTAPVGWLFCDGTSVLRADYAALFAVIGTGFGSADSTHFNVPDLQGKFLRGVDGSAGVDPDRSGRAALKTGGNSGNTVGSYQSDEFNSHFHGSQYDNRTPGSIDNGSQGDEIGGKGTIWTYPTTSTGGNETRPKNVYVQKSLPLGS